MNSIREFPAIDNITSEGIEVFFIQQGKTLTEVLPRKGVMNQFGIINPLLAKSLPYYHHPDRLKTPLKKAGNTFTKISFREAFDEIHKAVLDSNPNENVVFAGARLTNEEQYLIQKIARNGLKTNSVASFHYLNRGQNFNFDKNDIVPFAELTQSTKIYLLGADLSKSNPGFSHYLEKLHEAYGTKIIPLQDTIVSAVEDYYFFFKALNYYLISSGLAKGMFVQGLGKNYEQYRNALMQENFESLLEKNNLQQSAVIQFTEEILREPAPVFLFTEKDLTGNAIQELLHFTMLTEKQVKTGSGLLGLKECCNSQGLFDMGIFPGVSVGGKALKPESGEQTDIYDGLLNRRFKNCFIFGEDPIGCSNGTFDIQLLAQTPFLVVQDYFLTDTARQANIVLPATFPIETGGSFTNTAHIPQTFQKELDVDVELTNLQQLSAIGEIFGLPKLERAVDIFLEYVSFFSGGCNSKARHYFKYRKEDSSEPLFSSGCDHFQKLCME